MATGGTITVNPLSSPETRIQYLHCSSIDVVVGQTVYPWTFIGVTGDTAPPDTGITGIHLHLQVQEPGSGGEPCWNGRAFTNPETFPTPDLMRGTWRNVSSGMVGSISYETETIFRISGSDVGASGSGTRQSIFTKPNGFRCVARARWGQVRNTSQQQDGAVQITVSAPSCQIDRSCGRLVRCIPDAATGYLRLKSTNLLSVSGNYDLTRVGAYSRVADDEADFGIAIANPIENTKEEQSYMLVESLMTNKPDVATIAAAADGVDQLTFYGVHEDEEF